jgi:uroporphyrinogen decarboxylase
MSMTSYERVMTAIERKQPDRVPILPMARLFGISYAGMKIGECYEHPERYIPAQMQMVKDFGLDAVIELYPGAPLLNEAVGGTLIFEDGGMPTSPPIFQCPEDLVKAKTFDLSKQKRMQDLHSMIGKLKQEVKGEFPVIGFVHYPFRTAALMRGVQEFFMDMALNPSFVQDLLDFCLDVCKAYAEIVIDAGADIIFTSQSVANRDCISRKHYEQFVTGHETELNNFLKAKGKKILHHTCGDWSDRFDLVAAEAPDIAYVSATSNLAELKAKYGDRICLMGNVHAVDLMVRGTPQQVAEKAKECIEQAAAGGGYILSGDCDLAPNTPAENMKALEKAGKTFGVYPLKVQEQ